MLSRSLVCKKNSLKHFPTSKYPLILCMASLLCFSPSQSGDVVGSHGGDDDVICPLAAILSERAPPGVRVN